VDLEFVVAVFGIIVLDVVAPLPGDFHQFFFRDFVRGDDEHAVALDIQATAAVAPSLPSPIQIFCEFPGGPVAVVVKNFAQDGDAAGP